MTREVVRSGRHWFVVVVFILSGCVAPRPDSETIAATRSLDAIQAVFAGSSGKIHKVYSEKLKIRPDLQGRIFYRFTIGQNGAVLESVVAQSTLNDREVENRINDIITSLNFGPVSGPDAMEVIYPIDFLPP